jgi:hypothetical protein
MILGFTLIQLLFFILSIWLNELGRDLEENEECKAVDECVTKYTLTQHTEDQVHITLRLGYVNLILTIIQTLINLTEW